MNNIETFMEQTRETASAWLKLAATAAQDINLPPDEKAAEIASYLQASAREQLTQGLDNKYDSHA